MPKEVKWEESLFPISVLFSPLLRLRYRAAWQEAADKINSYFNKTLLNKASELENKQTASHIEFDLIEPPVGHIYVCDCHSKVLESTTTLFFNKSNNIEAAKIALPEAEETYFKDITLKEALNCLKFTSLYRSNH